MGERRGAYRVGVGKPQINRPFEKPGRTWEDNIKMDLEEVGWGVDWIDLLQERGGWRAVLKAVMNLRVP
jgi:hypothetical protein